ncbi:hypothetical protein BDV25DRAFT_157391 [Aspergillus avenaceus]|uniref:F-box domain-containing protein n=1 Tax=Aspergillus avenaceus TaxID=36643 RepID=A0A5N6TR51_ASPAV|nr:hypothetical protein BDV25DRAFT_157391 [Aspergillus avenaceus]
MPEGELWSTLVTTIDPSNIKIMPAVLQSTIDLLETELAKARTALKEIQPNATPALRSGDEIAAGAVAAYRQNLIARASDFYYGTHRLTQKELGLVPVVREVHPDDDDDNNDEEEETWRQPQKANMMTQPKRASLIDVLSNSLVLDHMAPYLSVSSLFALAATSRILQNVIMETPYVFRHLDLTQCRGTRLPHSAQTNSKTRMNGMQSLDEFSNADEFCPAPLRDVFARLGQHNLIQNVRTLILDSLPVPAALVAEIILTDRFSVNILSLRECHNLNERKLMQVLQHAVRPSRPKGTPRVKGIYYFTPISQPRTMARSRYRDWWSSKCVRQGRGENPLANEPPLPKDHHENSQYIQNAWYRASGRLFPQKIEEGWAQTIQMCEDIIAFDAVLCRGPRHNIDSWVHSDHAQDGHELGRQMSGLAIATISLGPMGCDGCHTLPEEPSIWGRSSKAQFPLLTPPPFHSSSVAVAKRPALFPERNPALVARCAECLVDRWCHRCNRWFCASCLPNPEHVGTNLSPHQTAVRGPRNNQSASLPDGRRVS